jgi:hypothetical protein
VRGLNEHFAASGPPRTVASKKPDLGFPNSQASVPSCPRLGGPVQLPENWREVSAREGLGRKTHGPGRAGRGPPGDSEQRVRSPGRPERKRLRAREWQRRSGRSPTVQPGSGLHGAGGGRGARLGRRCSARSGGLGELCPPVPKARAGDQAAGSPRL